MKSEIVQKLKVPSKQSPQVVKYEKAGGLIKKITVTYDEQTIDLNELRIRLMHEEQDLERRKRMIELLKQQIAELE